MNKVKSLILLPEAKTKSTGPLKSEILFLLLDIIWHKVYLTMILPKQVNLGWEAAQKNDFKKML